MADPTVQACSWFTSNGDPCRSMAAIRMTPDGPRCINHDPGRRAELRAQSIKGAERSRKVRAGRRAADREDLWADWPLRSEDGKQRSIASPTDCQALASWVTEQVVRDRLSAKEAREVTVAISAWLRAHSQGDVAKKVAELEDLVVRLTESSRKRPQGQIDP